jgi:hypothetical protein
LKAHLLHWEDGFSLGSPLKIKGFSPGSPLKIRGFSLSSPLKIRGVGGVMKLEIVSFRVS